MSVSQNLKVTLVRLTVTKEIMTRLLNAIRTASIFRKTFRSNMPAMHLLKVILKGSTKIKVIMTRRLSFMKKMLASKKAFRQVT